MGFESELILQTSNCYSFSHIYDVENALHATGCRNWVPNGQRTVQRVCSCEIQNLLDND